jgi:hypothetical protein
MSGFFVASRHSVALRRRTLSPVLWQSEVYEELRTARAQVAQLQQQRDDALMRLVLFSVSALLMSSSSYFFVRRLDLMY